MCVKKNLCPELGLNCCTSAWRSELLPTGLLGSVNRCCVHYSGFSIVKQNWPYLKNESENQKSLFYFFLIRSRACKIKA